MLEFRFPPVGGFDMEVVELEPSERVAWQVVDGPEEWVGTTIDWDLRQDGDYTIVLFKHEGWQEPVEFMHHCSTKWGSYPDEPEVPGGDRRGRAGAAGRADQRLALGGHCGGQERALVSAG